MVKFLFKQSIKIRNKMNPLKLPVNKEKWNELRTLKLSDYSNYLNTFPYKSDPLKGLIDHTGTFENFIDPNIKSGRDCDDWAMMYDLWGIFNKRISYTVIVTTKNKVFSNSHVVTVLYNPTSKKYTLCNYTPTTIANSLEDAIDGVRKWECYKQGYIYEIQSVHDPLKKEEIQKWSES